MQPKYGCAACEYNICSILRQHFGDSVHSNLPLADFYAVKPYANEGPLDYWISLNKAAEVTEQCLTSKEPMTDLSLHLVLMFIRNCPDKELALVFKSKPFREWTAHEVQDRLDEYLRERKVSRGRLSQHTAAIGQSPPERVATDNKPNMSSAFGCSSESEQLSSVSENSTLDKVLSLLEMALVSNTQSMHRGSRKQPPKRPHECQFCGSKEHNTRVHCRMNRLCVTCLSPGHLSALWADHSETVSWSEPGWPVSGKLGGLHSEEGNVGLYSFPSNRDDDIQSVYTSVCEAAPKDKTVIFQNMTRTSKSDFLFFTSVVAGDKVEL